MNFIKSLFSKRKDAIIDFDTIIQSEIIESNPINFGEKSLWICIKTSDPKAVLESFPLKELKKENWKEAFRKENEDYIFAVGPIEGWIILRGWMQQHPTLEDGMSKIHDYLNELSLKFNEAQYFLCHRTTDTAIWAKSISGKITRSYCIGQEVFFQSGQITDIEKVIGISNKSIYEFEEDKVGNYVWPGINELIKIANQWSINPNELESNKTVPGFGFMLKPYRDVLEVKRNDH